MFFLFFLDISLSVIFRQAVVSAHSALVNHSRDNTVTMASLELLTGLARLQFDSHSTYVCTQVGGCVYHKITAHTNILFYESVHCICG